MKSVEKLSRLANKLERKLNKLGQAQAGTLGITDLFFAGDEAKQRSFASAIQNQQGPVYKILESSYMKTQQPTSFNLKVNIAPGEGANWVLKVNPPTLKPQVAAALNGVYQKTVGGDMNTVAKTASSKVKAAGAAAGAPWQADVGSLDLS
jgi:hypothetical protein